MSKVAKTSHAVTVWNGDTYYLEEAPIIVQAIIEKWPYFKDWEFKPHKYKSLDVLKVVKNGMIVFSVNEDEYPEDGGVQQTFFSDKLEDLKQFLRDCHLDIPIESPYTLSQSCGSELKNGTDPGNTRKR